MARRRRTSPGSRYGYVLDDDDTVLPDPRSPRQPDGVHGTSQLHPIDPDGWTDDAWTGRRIAGACIYELHIGTFTAEGTFDAAIEQLDDLVDLGVDFVELMPVNAFNGTSRLGLRRRALVRGARTLRRPRRHCSDSSTPATCPRRRRC